MDKNEVLVIPILSHYDARQLQTTVLRKQLKCLIYERDGSS